MIEKTKKKEKENNDRENKKRSTNQTEIGEMWKKKKTVSTYGLPFANTRIQPRENMKEIK